MDSEARRLFADNLTVTRGSHQVLKGISFQVSAGEIYGLLGGNGAGKSTTLLTILGFISPSSGVIEVDGKGLDSDLAERRQAIAYLPESATLYEHLTARENLGYFLELAGTSQSDGEIDATLDQVGLPSTARDQRLSDYSKGMRQKVAIALAILRDTNTLLLDEPTSGLDPRAIDEFHDLARGLADQGKSVLMVTHDVYGACQVADRIGLLKDGQITTEFEASADSRIDTEAVHRAFTEVAHG